MDWGSNEAPGGSTAPGYNAIGTADYSVRWTGQIIPAFSETYDFMTASDAGSRLFIRPAGSATWEELINDWAAHPSAANDTAACVMTAGQTYDIEMDYFHAGGGAVAQLDWRSPSTPQEVIDPANAVGINMTTYFGSMFTDTMMAGRREWGDPGYLTGTLVATDANGWPLHDASNVVWESDFADKAGTYLLQFQGKADVTTSFSYGDFKVGSTDFGSALPSGAGYDPATNTTTATMTVGAVGLLLLTFTNSQRTADSPTDTGVTGVHLMRPTSAGASTYFSPGTLFDTNLENDFRTFTTLRWLTANFNEESNWSDRALPGTMGTPSRPPAYAWEYMVMLSNETGKDLYITIPMRATDDYVRNLANLIKYGSDGVNPYTSPQAHPVYPGLNPNLKVYVEWSNETWNWEFPQAQDGAELARAAVENNTPDGQIINFDGQAPEGDFRRYTALRTVEASDIFRSVWGDSVMGDRIRMLLEYQYNDYNWTATEALFFVSLWDLKTLAFQATTSSTSG